MGQGGKHSDRAPVSSPVFLNFTRPLLSRLALYGDHGLTQEPITCTLQNSNTVVLRDIIQKTVVRTIFNLLMRKCTAYSKECIAII